MSQLHSHLWSLMVWKNTPTTAFRCWLSRELEMEWEVNKFSPALKKMVRSKAFPFLLPQEACMPQAFKVVQILYTNSQSEISVWKSSVRNTQRAVCTHIFENSLRFSRTPVQISQEFVGNSHDLNRFIFTFVFKYLRI